MINKLLITTAYWRAHVDETFFSLVFHLIATSNSTAGQNMTKKMQRPQLPSDLASAPNTLPPGWACFLTYEEHIPTSGLPTQHSLCLECFSHTSFYSCSLISSGSLLKRCLISRGFPANHRSDRVPCRSTLHPYIVSRTVPGGREMFTVFADWIGEKRSNLSPR